MGNDDNPDLAPVREISDDKPDPLTTEQRERRKKGLEAKLNGKAYGKTHQVARGQYVELSREGEGAVWTVLGEFSDYPHNSIAQPDRAVNNTTIWVPDFNRSYYLDLLFNATPGANSMRKFEAQKTLAPSKVRGKGQYAKDQSGVWSEVGKVNAKAGKAPSTGTLTIQVASTAGPVADFEIENEPATTQFSTSSSTSSSSIAAPSRTPRFNPLLRWVA